jgi:ABC-type amino acid transport substrate-binding protein
MKKLAFLLVILFPLVVQAADESAYDRVIARNELVCGVIPWAPYKVLDANTKEWSGFAIDIYRKVFATLDIKVTFKEVVLGNQIQDLNSGRVDAICDDGPWTLSASKFIDFSNPVYVAPVYLYVRKDDNRFKSRNDLDKKEIRFAGIDGDVSNDLVPRLFPHATLASMPGTTDAAQLLLNVSTEKADVTIIGPSEFFVFEKNNPGQLKALFKDTPLGNYECAISVKKGDFKMLGLVNQAINNGRNFGITNKIIDEFDPKHEKLLRVRSPYTF